MNHKPVMLLIRDGWGINPAGREAAKANGDATLLARTPFHDELYKSYPRARLSASGLDVGLPAGQMGNSEVGHMNLGAGRIIYQEPGTRMVRLTLHPRRTSFTRSTRHKIAQLSKRRTGSSPMLHRRFFSCSVWRSQPRCPATIWLYFANANDNY